MEEPGGSRRLERLPRVVGEIRWIDVCGSVNEHCAISLDSRP
jgi:hypothetical protein